MANKNDFEIEKLKASVEKFHLSVSVIKHLFSLVFAIIALEIFFTGLKPFLTSSPEAINAIAKVVESVNISNITGYILAGGSSTGWILERKGKKRAIKQKSKYQQAVEGGDVHRSSSGLTETGETP